VRLARLDTRRISDWDTFHDVFTEVFGFPDFYGRNMDAWIDCMTCLDDATAELSEIQVLPGEVVVLELEHVNDFVGRCPELFEEIVDCASFVNWRRIERGIPAVLALSFYKTTYLAGPPQPPREQNPQNPY